MAEDLARGIIGKLTPIETGPEYDEAVQAGSLYWLHVLKGKDLAEAKRAADEALSRLLGCRAEISGKKRTLRERLFEKFHDSNS